MRITTTSRNSASLPAAVAVDRAGNIYIADSLNHRIRRVDAAIGVITTAAGNGVGRYDGDSRPATATMIGSPTGFANQAVGFGHVNAFGTAGGTDSASLYDSAGYDQLAESRANAKLTNGSVAAWLTGFEWVTDFATAGGTNRKSIGTVNYMSNLVGDWQ